MTNGKDRLGEICRWLGDLAENADAALETAHKQSGQAGSEATQQKSTAESRVSVRTLDGEQVYTGDMFEVLAHGPCGKMGDIEGRRLARLQRLAEAAGIPKGGSDDQRQG